VPFTGQTPLLLFRGLSCVPLFPRRIAPCSAFWRRFAAGAGGFCTIYGAGFASKKIAFLAQNLENKGPGFFLPPRSMVLKVVRGKIFKTLELRQLNSGAAPNLETLVD
jgi:hypothetical protein